MPDEKQPKERIIAIPSDRLWIDPLLITAATQFFLRSTPVVLGQFTPFAPANARRILLAIPAQQGIGSGAKICPFPGSTNLYFDTTSATVPSRYTIFDWPGIVGNTWYVSPPTGGNFAWIEVLRNPGA